MVTLAAPQKMFANDRTIVQEGYAGDVIGLTNPGAFAIGVSAWGCWRDGSPEGFAMLATHTALAISPMQDSLPFLTASACDLDP